MLNEERRVLVREQPDRLRPKPMRSTVSKTQSASATQVARRLATLCERFEDKLDLQSRYDDLKDEAADLKDEINNEIVDLKEEINDLKDVIASIKDEYNTIRLEHRDLQIAYTDTMTRFDLLRKRAQAS